MKSFILLITLLFTFSAIAGEQVLVKITNQEDSELTKLVIETDEDSNLVTFYKDIHSSKGKLLKRERLNDKQISTNKGTVVNESKGKEVIILRSPNFSRSSDCDFTIDYLYNGVTGKRKTLTLKLLRFGDTWELELNGKKVSKLHFLSNKAMFIGTIGIKSIVVN